jgi:hypothetical protein
MITINNYFFIIFRYGGQVIKERCGEKTTNEILAQFLPGNNAVTVYASGL